MGADIASRPSGPAGLRAPLARPLLLPAVVLLIGVAVQVVYPHVTGAGRDVLTITTVLLFSLGALLHVGLTRGLGAAAMTLLVLGGGGLVAEVVGVATGFPFGDYVYSDRLGPMVGDVPLLIPLAWLMLGWPSAVVADLLLGPVGRVGAGRRAADLAAFTAVGAVALSTWDLFLDPQMVGEGYWTWEATGPAVLSGIPAVNHLGWLVVAAVMMALLHPVLRGRRARAGGHDDRIPVAVYLWTWVGSTVAHLFYLGLPVSGVVGGLAMGVVALAAIRVLALPPSPR